MAISKVDFTFWENPVHRKFDSCVPSVVDLVGFTFSKKIEKKNMCYDLSMVDLVDLAFWGKEYVLYRFL